MNKRLQIGVMGAGHDLDHNEKLHTLAREVGRHIADAGHILIYGANKDEETLPTDSARGAKEVGGMVIGITYNKGLNVLRREHTDAIIATGSVAGGGRELVLVNSCDVIIMISGGAGTLIEAAIAYEMNIPIVGLVGSGGWTDRLADSYIDERNRIKILPAHSPAEAVQMAISACEK